MTSLEHERMVTTVIESGMRTPDERPSDQLFRAVRDGEAAAPVGQVEGCTVIGVDAGGVPALRVVPDATPTAATVLYLHGGGYLWMTPNDYLPVLGSVARASGAPCLGVHYRRAPEHPFPGAVDDAVTAYRWLLDSGVHPGEIVLAGDSAGGGLAVAAAVALRDRGLPSPAGLSVFSPWTDLAVTGAGVDTADDPVVSGTALRMMASLYLDGAEPTDPLASPLYADLGGLPPLHIQVGGREALLDDARRLAERACLAGVEVTYLEHPGVIHMWMVFDPGLPESVDAFARLGAFVRERSGAVPRAVAR
jgi:monoterpene epsilon-lactone hydrolase